MKITMEHNQRHETRKGHIYKVMKFGISGILSNVLSLYAFHFAMEYSKSRIFSTVLSYLLGVAMSFTASRYWTFRSANLGTRKKLVIKFLTAYMLGMLYCICLTAVLESVGLAPITGQIITVLTCAIFLYMAQSLIVFK